jgi:hypothetical protein
LALKKENEVKPTKMFKVVGPFLVKPIKGKAARRIEKDQSAFWDHQSTRNVRDRVGCYAFGIRAGKGIRPVYVGKTLRSFGEEVFGSHQRDYYNAELANIRRGTPVLFFIVYPKGKGKVNQKMIRDVEEFLIQIAVAKNSNLRNVQGVGEKKWGISGVLRSGKGKTPSSSASLKGALGIRKK